MAGPPGPGVRRRAIDARKPSRDYRERRIRLLGDVEWLTSPQFATQRMHCNGATLVHGGGGKIDLPRGVIESSNCVDVLVRCTGGC